MRKWKWLLGLLALPLIYVAIVITLRAIGPSDEQKHALVLMTTPPFEIQRDAFAALWLMPFDVPEAELEAVARRDIEAFKPMQGSPPTEQFKSLAAKDYPHLPAWEAGMPEPCVTSGPECIADVRANPEHASAWVARNDKRLQKIEALAQYDGLGIGFSPSYRMPFPQFTGIQPLLEVSALLQFDRGEKVQAVDRLCRQTDTWRRLAAHSTHVLPRTVISAFFARSSEMTAFLLAELPAEHAAPESCAVAFAAPSSMEPDLCAPMQGELRLIHSGYQEIADAQAESVGGALAITAQNLLFYDVEATSHALASQLSPYCAAQRHEAQLLDQPYRDKAAPLRCAWHQRMHNWMGCTLMEVSAPIHDDYQERALDHAARIRLMGGLLWWRAQREVDETAEARLARMPADFFSATRPIELIEDGRALRIRNFYQAKEAGWQVPLPGTAVAASAKPAAAAEPAPGK